jgi:glutathione peroxidase
MERTKLFIYALLFVGSAFCSAQKTAQAINPEEGNKQSSNKEMTTNNFYDIEVVTLDGKTIKMDQFAGKTILIVNVASKCGYTSQYKDLQAFYLENEKHDFVILGVPSNQFGGQEPGDGEEIASFCEKNYGVSFPMLEKSDVKGENQSPLYQWLTNADLNGWNKDVPNWNFCKYLISPKGKLVAFMKSSVLPGSEEFIAAMQKM